MSKRQIKTTPADRFDYNRLYGQEKYNLNNMTLAKVNFPYSVNEGKITSVWSDHIYKEYRNAIAEVTSAQNGDAFWNGVSSEQLLKFASDVAKAVNFEPEVTGVRIVRFTNVMSGYPVLRIDIASGGVAAPLRIQKDIYRVGYNTYENC